MIKFIDTFAGIGGFHLGIEQAAKELYVEAKCVTAIEIDKAAQETYEQNYGVKPLGDITKCDPGSLPDHDILTGGFPCQPFSRAGKYHQTGKGVLDRSDGRTNLLLSLIDILLAKKPKTFIFENVKGLTKAKNEDGSLYIDELKRLIDEAGYNLSFQLLNSKDFGLPQSRERIYFVGIRKDLGKSFDFSKLEYPEGFSVVADILEPNPVDGKLYASHIWRNWTVLDSLGSSGSMKKNFTVEKGQPRLLALKEVLDTFKGGRSRVHRTINLAKIEGDTPSGVSRQGDRLYSINGISPTLQTSTATLFDMGSDDMSAWRVLTPRECARVQGFPETFQLHPKASIAKKQFGNAVSVPVVKAVAKALLQQVWNLVEKSDKPHYTIGEITCNEDGEFGVVWWGEHAEQGGINFTKGNSYSTDLDGLFSYVASNMKRCLEQYKETIAKKREKKDD